MRPPGDDVHVIRVGFEVGRHVQDFGSTPPLQPIAWCVGPGLGRIASLGAPIVGSRQTRTEDPVFSPSEIGADDARLGRGPLAIAVELLAVGRAATGCVGQAHPPDVCVADSAAKALTAICWAVWVVCLPASGRVCWRAFRSPWAWAVPFLPIP